MKNIYETLFHSCIQTVNLSTIIYTNIYTELKISKIFFQRDKDLFFIITINVQIIPLSLDKI